MNNKQTMEKTMRKIAMVIGILSVLATNANATMIWSKPNIFGGNDYVSSDSGLLGWSQPNIYGGYDFRFN